MYWINKKLKKFWQTPSQRLKVFFKKKKRYFAFLVKNKFCKKNRRNIKDLYFDDNLSSKWEMTIPNIWWITIIISGSYSLASIDHFLVVFKATQWRLHFLVDIYIEGGDYNYYANIILLKRLVNSHDIWCQNL